MNCDFNGLRRNLAAAYNRHVDEINLTDSYTDMSMKESCAEIGTCIAALLALYSDDGIANLSDEITLRSPFGED